MHCSGTVIGDPKIIIKDFVKNDNQAFINLSGILIEKKKEILTPFKNVLLNCFGVLGNNRWVKKLIKKSFIKRLINQKYILLGDFSRNISLGKRFEIEDVLKFNYPINNIEIFRDYNKSIGFVPSNGFHAGRMTLPKKINDYEKIDENTIRIKFILTS
jgi:hypothetical protein